jgi:exopolysaccharide biosynthesis protein
MAISNEKLNCRKPSLSACHLGILTNIYDAINSNKNTCTFTKPTRSAARGSFQRKHLEDNQIKRASHSGDGNHECIGNQRRAPTK